MERFRLTIAYSLALIVLYVAAGWVQSLEPPFAPDDAQSLDVAPVVEAVSGAREEVVEPWMVMVAIAYPALLIALVLFCERNPVRTGRLLRSRGWAPFVLSFPYFFLLALSIGIVARLVLMTPVAQLFSPLGGFAAANTFLLWGLFFSLLAVLSLPTLEKWVSQRYP